MSTEAQKLKKEVRELKKLQTKHLSLIADLYEKIRTYQQFMTILRLALKGD